MNDRTEGLTEEEDDMRDIWIKYFKGSCHVDIEDQVTGNVCQSENSRSGNYFGGGEPVKQG